MRVLVAGATGTLGRALVDAALAAGHEVVALARRPDAVRARLAGVRAADVTRPEQLRGACDGVDVVVSAIGLVGKAAMRSKLTHEQVDHEGNRNLLREAEGAGVRKFVYVSAVHAEDPQGVPLLEAKQRFERDLKASRLDWLVFRPTALYDEIADGIFEQARRGVVVLAGDGLARVAPLSAEDCAHAIVERLSESGREVALGGPDRFTYNGIAEMSFQILGKPSRVVRVPQGLATAATTLLRSAPGALHGEARFLLHVLGRDTLAPAAGKQRLRVFLEARRKS